MEDSKPEKIVVIITHGVDDPEKATLAFVHANAALAVDVEVVVVLQGIAVFLAKKGCYEHLFWPGFDPIHKLLNYCLEFGGKVFVCTPCIQERQITTDMLVDKVEPIKSGSVIQHILEAKAVLSY